MCRKPELRDGSTLFSYEKVLAQLLLIYLLSQ